MCDVIVGDRSLRHLNEIVQGHGTFAVGGILEEAHVATARIEQSCKIRYYLDLMGESENQK